MSDRAARIQKAKLLVQFRNIKDFLQVRKLRTDGRVASAIKGAREISFPKFGLSGAVHTASVLFCSTMLAAAVGDRSISLISLRLVFLKSYSVCTVS